MTSGGDYERLVDKLISTLPPDVAVSGPRPGRKNTVVGKSGYKHQIDVSVRSAASADGPFLLLIECKYRDDKKEKEKVVGVESVLVLASRLADVRAAESVRVDASIVSMKPCSAGARKLADHFRIQLDMVASLEQYAVLTNSRPVLS